MRLSFANRMRALVGIPIRTNILELIGTEGTALNGPAWRYTDFARDGYKRNPIVRACIDRIVAGLFNLDVTFERDGDKIDPKDYDPTLQTISTLLHRPRPHQSRRSFLGQWFKQLALGGGTFITAAGVGKDPYNPSRTMTAPRLKLWRPDRMKIIVKNGEIAQFVYKDTDSDGNSKDIRFRPEQVCYIRYDDPEHEYQFCSPLEAAEYSIKSSNEYMSWNLSVLGNAGVPAGVLTVKGIHFDDKKQRQKIQKEFSEDYGGAGNAGKVVVVGGESSEYKQLAVNPKEMDWTSGKQVSMREICAVLNVPSVLVGDTTRATYSNMAAALEDFYLTCVIPTMEWFLEELGDWLFPQYGIDDYTFTVDNSRVAALQEDRDALADRLEKADWLTPNEKREEWGVEAHPDPEADQLYLLLRGKAPIDLAADDAAAPDDTDDSDDATDVTDATDATDKTKDKKKKPIRTTYRHIPWPGQDYPEEFPRSHFPTLRSREVYVRYRERNRDDYNDRYKSALRRYWKGQMERSLTNLRSHPFDVREIPPLFDPEVEAEFYINEFRKLQGGMFIELSKRALDEINWQANPENIFTPEYIANDLAQRSRLINETTASEIREILQANATAPYKEREQLLKDYFGKQLSGREQNIARTEIARADTIASRESYMDAKKGGVNLDIEWISARDRRVRTFSAKSDYDHYRMDGQLADADGLFDGSPGGQRGLVSGPAVDGDPGFVCNCRCVIGPVGSF